MAKIQFRNNDTSGNGQIRIDGVIPMWAELYNVCQAIFERWTKKNYKQNLSVYKK